MKRYLVGGAVRDPLLGIEVKDRDWVVVGADAARMVAAGFRPVGRDFPVFLDPETGDEVALARTERKTGPGYRGFEVNAAPTVTLEEDLQRRDLTINAMAREIETGCLIDPWHGQADLEARVLRHVSPAFAEDPVRILRVARFAARFAPLGFRVAPETTALMREMVKDGEVDALVPERVWQELSRALGEARPSAFLQVLRAAGALARILPEVDRLYGVPTAVDGNATIDTGLRLEQALDAGAHIAPGDTAVTFATLMHGLGKGVTPAQAWPHHAGHESHGVPLIEAVCERLRAPRDHTQLALRACKLEQTICRAQELSGTEIVRLIEQADGLRRPEAFEQLLLVSNALHPTPGGTREPGDFLRRCRAAAAAVSTREIAAQGISGPAFGEALAARRAEAIEALRASDARDA